MTIWLVRAGGHGEFEQKFIQDEKIYLTWGRLSKDLSGINERAKLFDTLQGIYPDSKSKRLHNWVNQIWPFAHKIKKGDWVVLPLKSKPAIFIGEVVGDYVFENKGPNPYYHSLKVKWIGSDIPRSNFGKDQLYSFGAFMTICRISRNNAEERLIAMRKTGWQAEKTVLSEYKSAEEIEDVESEEADLEELARDEISKLIMSRFKGHGLARLVEGILEAQGYKTYRSPEGPDGSIDILAATGAMGFGEPRICVQVKSQDSAVELAVLTQLKGAMGDAGADQGLLVAWGGFKNSFNKETRTSFFKVRLWDQKELLNQIFDNYEKLDDDLKAELPLKRIWTVAAQEEE